MSRPAAFCQSRWRVLVEGPDDISAVVAILRAHEPDWQKNDVAVCRVESCGGFQQLRAKLDSLLFKSHERVAVIVDADEDSSARWQSVRDRLGEFGFTLPTFPVAGGWIGQHDNCVCGVWLMPDNVNRGMLETFLAALMKDDDTLWPHAQSATRAAHSYGARFPLQSIDKAAIHTWLAWQHDPGMTFGAAITDEVLNPYSPIAQSFVEWIKRVFPKPWSTAPADGRAVS